jgi:predicted ATPase/class 3 adenylate cyclase
MAELPAGTVTFLYTDIEGSTARWEHQPEAMRAAVERHDNLVRQAVAAAGGHVFRYAGDGLCAAFATAPAAVAAALAAQRALAVAVWGATGPLRARMALHTGAVELRDGDYLGACLNRVARLLAAGHGGQVLLSQATADLIREALPAGASLRDMGAHRLRDLVQAEPIYQLLHPDLPADFQPLRSLEAAQHNLPVQVTSFVGREAEMAEVTRLLTTTHLLTLTGAGGCGKTRLALQVAAEVMDAYPDGVWVVELAPLADPALVAQTVASVVGVRETAGRPLQHTIIDSLRSRQLLLVLDNCEHLLDACAALADGLMRGCPRLRILATSREVLGITGETSWRVPSLSAPPPTGSPSVAALGQYEAVRLFVERALAVQPDFQVTPANGPAIAQVCWRLDGIPLAIELAVARLRVLTPEQIVSRLDDRFRLLTGGSRTALRRQQTLEATIDWSYSLLTKPEHELLRRLAVFAGGWTLAAAEDVVAAQGTEACDVLDRLVRLVEKSLVVAEPGSAGETRYGLLETVRQYARERLEETSVGGSEDEMTLVRDRHLAYFLRLAEEAEPELRDIDQDRWLVRLETEHDNFRAALEWAVARHPIAGLRLAAALIWFWYLHGHFGEGRRWVERGLAAVPAVPRDELATKALAGAEERELLAARARAIWSVCVLIIGLADYTRATDLGEESLAIARYLDEPDLTAWALMACGIAEWYRGNLQRAADHLSEALGLFRTLGKAWETAYAAASLGIVLHDLGEDERALQLLEESLAMLRRRPEVWALAIALRNLATVIHAQGDHARALVLLEEALALRRQSGDKRGMALALNNLAGMAHAADATERTIQLSLESLDLCLATGDRGGLAIALLNIGRATARCGEAAKAVRFIAGAIALRKAIGTPLPTRLAAETDREVACLREALGDQEFAAAWSTGERLSIQELVAEVQAGDKPGPPGAPPRHDQSG